ncbi:MAG: cyclic nucleotide-binding domain-containing protein [Candidatus Eisenbacteria bacterium]|uniref:Cyclic nucleotide-binding domain-containing protein n=1 Tax=Eiseniibacteriota bacterium TaxID=2212470 RepID=A0A849SG02_UNCEI|nr:cyclic nucleotide-binding domain-containing protein [Candidatus Eisenbacteria bacterium]
MEALMTLVEKTMFLKSVALLSGVPTEPLAQIASRAREIHVDPGEALFREGEPNRGVFLVVVGRVVISQGSALHGIRSTGDGIGELALAESEPHKVTAVAMDHVHVVNIPTTDLFEIMLDFPEVGVSLARFLAGRVFEVGQRIGELEGQVAHLNAVIRAAGLTIPDPSTVLGGEPATKR